VQKFRVLMLGWEYPPIINGGLGVACKGFSDALAEYAEVTLLLPMIDRESISSQVELIGLNQLEVEDQVTTESTVPHSKVQKLFSSIRLDPYYHEEEEKILENIVTESGSTKSKTETTQKRKINRFEFDSLYGGNMLSKVMAFSDQVKALARDRSFDVIHAHDWMTFLAGIEIKFDTGKPLVLHVHSLDYDRGGSKSKGWIYEVEKYAMEQADTIIAVSDYTANVIREHYQIDPEKVVPVYNGIGTVSRYKSEKHFPEKLVLFLGRITDQKGPEYFLDIARKVFEKYDNVRFVMAGTGDKLKRLIEAGAYNDIGNKFHFTGFLDKQKVHDLLSMADVYLMPSVSEPFGLSALEAAQFGIPCVLSNQSGASEVLKSARTADYWDTELMADHIIKILEDPKEAKRMVKAAESDLKVLTWDRAARETLRIYQDLVVTSE